MVKNSKRIFYIEKTILPGRLSNDEMMTSLLIVDHIKNRKFAPMSTPNSLSTTVHIHDTIETESKIKKFDEKRGAFCPRLSFLFCFHKPIFKKSLYTFYF